MAVLKCKMCGAPLSAEEGQGTVQCRYCESVQTIPRLDDELKLKWFDRATELRLKCEFDQAFYFFQNIIAKFSDEPEAYWGMCLCKYGIEYVDDPATGRKVPTCHRTNPVSIFADSNYLTACEYAGAAKWKYEEEAAQIDEIQKKILDISRNEKPYDIFICYKETDDLTRLRTEDSITAQDIYTELIKNGYNVFYAKNSLRGKAGTEYEPYIYAALSSAKVMLVLGSKKEYFDAVWVKNEWSRFISMMKDTSKALIPCFENLSAEDLPVHLRSFQGLDMSSKIFFGDLMASIKRLIPKEREVPQTVYENNKYTAFAPDVHGSASSPTASDATAFATRKELNFKEGVYVGDALGNRPHGVGTYFFTNGDKYEGEWNMGLYHGKGTFTYSKGESWSGQWYKGEILNGSGAFYTTPLNAPKVECLVGTFKDGKLHGDCKKLINNQIVREGHFEDGVLNGDGVSYINGRECRGVFKDGMPYDAQGYYLFETDGKRLYYDGEWHGGKPEGRGRYEGLPWSDSVATITGEFRGGVDGEVEIIAENGASYKGMMKNFRFHGKGVYQNSVICYDGEYREGKYHGKGVLKFLDRNEYYEGDFENGMFHGNGTYVYPQGSWTGEWKDDKRWKGHGLLIYIDNNGKNTGKFFNGYIVEGMAAGKGILRFEDGSRFDGEFYRDDYFNGTVYNANNQPLHVYENGRRKWF